MNATIEARPFDAALGAEIRCGDVRALSDDAIAQIRRGWLEHLVVLFRGQTLIDAELIRFGRRFGALQLSNPLPDPRASAGVLKQGGREERFPEVTVVSNIVEGDVAIGGLGDGELVWHSDMSSFVAPPNQTILYALEVTAQGGETGFVNMYAAWDEMPSAMRAEIAGLALKHDATIDAAGNPRRDHNRGQTTISSMGNRGLTPNSTRSEGATHPLVRTHPETGANCLYLGRRAKSYLAGLELAQSERLLDRLWSHATQERFTWHHRWQAGDVLMWDNRAVMHRRNAFDRSARRLLHRVVVQGTAPYNDGCDLAPHPRAARLRTAGHA